jgi:hypothetical protein
MFISDKKMIDVFKNELITVELLFFVSAKSSKAFKIHDLKNMERMLLFMIALVELVIFILPI